MSKFITDLEMRCLNDTANDYRGQWILLSPLVYQSDILSRTIVVPTGFVSDLESCPRLPGVFLLFGQICREAAVVHDWLYTHPAKCTRAQADAVLKEACIVSGIPAWRAWGIWAGVRVGGGSHFAEAPKVV